MGPSFAGKRESGLSPTFHPRLLCLFSAHEREAHAVRFFPFLFLFFSLTALPSCSPLRHLSPLAMRHPLPCIAPRLPPRVASRHSPCVAFRNASPLALRRLLPRVAPRFVLPSATRRPSLFDPCYASPSQVGRSVGICGGDGVGARVGVGVRVRAV